MRKRIAIMSFLLFFVVGGCEKKSQSISLADFMEEIKMEAKFENGILEDLKNPEIAQLYGINPENIRQGYVYYEKDKTLSEKIIILEAIDEKSIEDLEKAVNNESTGLNEAFEENGTEVKKLDKSFIKTKGKYVLFVNAEEFERLEKLVDEKFK